jgi:16S rRNA (guanine527-N7)-methyltransferase
MPTRPPVSKTAELLTSAGVERGLLGPREASRVWERHLLNCAVVGELLPRAARVVDVGSGAGLPGIPLACARPDLRIDLVEPLARRVTFLEEAVAALALAPRVSVVRGRAEERAVVRRVAPVAWVTARAVAPLDRLAAWCLPLLQPGGCLLALKGRRAAQELNEYRDVIGRLGGVDQHVVLCGVDLLASPSTVVVIRRRK